MHIQLYIVCKIVTWVTHTPPKPMHVPMHDDYTTWISGDFWLSLSASAQAEDKL